MKKFLRWKPVQFATYLVVRFLAMVVNMFPLSHASRVGRVVGQLLHALDLKHRKIAAKNLERAGHRGSIPRMIRRVYREIGLGAVEMLMLPRMLQYQRFSRFVTLRNFDVFDRELARGKGVIVVIAHQGNWEIGGLATCLAGYPLHSLARPIENPYLDRWVLQSRTSTGQRIIPKYNALQAMIRVLKSNGMLVIQADQDAKQMGVLANFFGRPASTIRSPALLSLKYDAPIVPVEIYRENGHHYAVTSEPLYPADFRALPDPVRAITQAFTTRLEEFVRRHPEQWNWLHRRWKSYDRGQMVEEPAESAAG
jgi:Kdo2-lipid IVA lauroyltransferase/acyltransferase